MKRVVVLCAGLAVAVGCDAGRGLHVSGRVLGDDGRPLSHAWVFVDGMGTRRKLPAAADGSIDFRLDRPGAYFLWVVGPHHRTMLRALYADRPSTVHFDARLAPIEWSAPADGLFVIGAFNAFARRDGARPMTRRSDGTYTATIETAADTFAYQIVGAQPDGLPLAGTAADHCIVPAGAMLVAGRAGAVVSVLRADSDSVCVVFDPRELPRTGQGASFHTRDARSRGDRFTAIGATMDSLIDRWARSARGSGGRPSPQSAAAESTLRAEVRRNIALESDPVSAQYATLVYFSRLPGAPADSTLARHVLAATPPRSVLWSALWGGPLSAWGNVARCARQNDRTRAYARLVIERHPDRQVRAAFLFQETGSAFAAKNRAERIGPGGERVSAIAADRDFVVLYDRLQSEFAGTDYAKRAKGMWAPDRAIQAGRPLPDFTIASLEDSITTLSARGFRGQLLLVDFWAVWCGPCVAEMPALHRVYERYRDRGFSILSISFDPDQRDVETFRRRRWPMPWAHARVREGFRSPLAAKFEVVGIPQPILVDREGVIRATGAALRGDKLDAAVEVLIAASPAP